MPSAPLLAVRDGEEGHDEEVDALAAIRFGLPWKGPCPVLNEVSRCERQLVTVLAVLGDSEVVAVMIFNAGTDPSRVSMIGVSEVS